MTKISEIAFWLACDDVRQEINGKVTFVGVYGEDVLVPAVPLRVPQLCVVVFLKLENIAFDKLGFKIEDPNGKNIAALNLVPQKIDFKQNSARAIIYLSPWEWKEAGKYKLYAQINDASEQAFGEIEVKLAKQSR